MAKKPTIRILTNKVGLKIVKTMYDDFGKVLKKQTEFIRR
jgi:hypothetical protein